MQLIKQNNSIEVRNAAFGIELFTEGFEYTRDQEEDKSKDSDDSDNSTDSDDSDPNVFKLRHKEEAHVVLCIDLFTIGLDTKKWHWYCLGGASGTRDVESKG